MNKVEILFIRACKSRDPYTRIQSVYNRFYIRMKMRKHDGISILEDICEKYCPMPPKKLANDLMYSTSMMPDKDIATHIFESYVSHIRLTERKKFPMETIPAKFRDNYKV